MFLTIKKIPIKTWSSENPLNFKPKFSTFFFLCLGLVLFGLGEGLLVLSTTGNSPWSVFAEGISKKTGISIGAATFIVSVSVLFLWIFLKQKPGIGTVMNIIIIAGMIDVTLLSVVSVLLVGLGSGIYLVANLGPGPRDGLMTGLTKITNLPIAFVRACLEISVVLIGWYLGGTVGVGTLIFAFGIGPAVAFGLFFVNKIS